MKPPGLTKEGQTENLLPLAQGSRTVQSHRKCALGTLSAIPGSEGKTGETGHIPTEPQARQPRDTHPGQHKR